MQRQFDDDPSRPCIFRSLSGLIWLTVACTLPCNATEIPFALPHQVHLGGFDGVISVRAGDLDQDGDFDLVAASPIEGQIRWYENELGDGSLWTEGCVDHAFLGVFTIEVADVDGDGDPDVVAGSATGDVSWFEQTGAAGCGWTQHAVTDFEGSLVRSIALADVSVDGDLDIFSIVDDQLRVSYNLGDGAFSGSDVIGSDLLIVGGTSIFAGDIDGDGDADVVSAEKDPGQISWWENESNARACCSFAGEVWPEVSVFTGLFGARAVTLADLDSDGDLDVVAATDTEDPSPRIVWWANTTGDGSSWSETRSIDGGFDGAWSVAATDMDRDGDLDVVAAAENEDALAWWEQTRPGGVIAWTRHDVSNLLDGGRAAIAEDLDGDGDPDLVAAAFEGDFVAWWQNETIHRSALLGPTEVDITGAFDNPSAVAPGDIDGDGAVDVASVAISQDEIAWWRNDDALGTSWSKTTVGTSFLGRDVLLGDLDLDGDLDLVAPDGTSGTSIHWWQNDLADGSSWTQHLLKAGARTEHHFLADFDLDGAVDIAAYDPFAADVLWFRNPGGLIEWTPFLVEDVSTQVITVADLDSDGDMDFAGSLASGGVIVWWDNTAGDGSTWSRLEIDPNIDLLEIAFLAVGDLDNDGAPDLLGLDVENGEPDVVWWQNRLATGESWIRNVVPGLLAGAHQALITDLDLDGDLDITASGTTGGSIVWWQNLGAGQSWQQESSISIAGPEAIAPADFDGDGDPDIVAVAADQDRVLWLPNLGGQLGLPPLDTTPTTLEEGAIDDLLEITALHRGRIGDSDQQLAKLSFRLEESVGDPLSTAEAEALIDRLAVYLDDGSGIFEPAIDTLVVEDLVLELKEGVASLSPTEGDPSAQVSLGASRTYFLTLTAAAGAAQQTPNSVVVTHLPTAETAEDVTHGIGMTVEEAPLLTSSLLTFVAPPPPCFVLTLAHTGSGAALVAAPAASPTCLAGSYIENEVITLTAAPDSSWQVSRWAGTDDDNTPSHTNFVTMPGADHSATVHYVLPDIFSDGFESGDTTMWSN